MTSFTISSQFLVVFRLLKSVLLKFQVSWQFYDIAQLGSYELLILLLNKAIDACKLFLFLQKVGKLERKKDRAPERFLSATFADIPAPEWQWEEMPAAPVPRLDGAAIQIENLFYVFAGYGTLDWVRKNIFSTSLCQKQNKGRMIWFCNGWIWIQHTVAIFEASLSYAYGSAVLLIPIIAKACFEKLETPRAM